jgi:thiol-disulfide isomerase/thioredoxin
MSHRIIATCVVLAMAIAAMMTLRSTSARSADMSMPAATTWLNGPPQAAGDLRGKIVLVQFWTYTCVNWRRTLPYVRAWSSKYRDQGLVVIGVHTPEFDFEENIDNVRSSLVEMHIDYPVAIDNQHAIWDAFHNVYWPALYLLDAQGRIRYHQFGEGEYARTEREIQKLLAESGSHPALGLADVTPIGAEIPADIANLRSPESYVGYASATGFASKGGAVPNLRHDYVFPRHLSLNEWALSGLWTVGRQAALLNDGGGKIAYRFRARDLNLIMAPSGTAIHFRLLIDGQPPGASHGEDVDEQGYGTVSEPRMYQLIRQSGKIVERESVVEFYGPGVSVYDFTFG